VEYQRRTYFRTIAHVPDRRILLRKLASTFKLGQTHMPTASDLDGSLPHGGRRRMEETNDAYTTGRYVDQFRRDIVDFLSRYGQSRLDIEMYRRQLSRVAAAGWPHFISVSPPRSATTWLFRQIRQSSDLFLPDVKETNILWCNWRNPDLFPECIHAAANGASVGDLSPSNALLPEVVISAIREFFPNIRIVLLLREPGPRAISHIVFDLLRSGKFTSRQVCEFDFPTWAIVLSSFARLYLPGALLSRWLQHFPSDRIRPLFVDDLTKDWVGETFEGLVTFLGGRMTKSVSSEAVNALDYDQLLVPRQVLNFACALSVEDRDQLREILLRSFGITLPLSWYREDQSPSFLVAVDPRSRRCLRWENRRFVVEDKYGKEMLRTSETFSALAASLLDQPLALNDERAREVHMAVESDPYIPAGHIPTEH
jgi:hypothetical protein